MHILSHINPSKIIILYSNLSSKTDATQIHSKPEVLIFFF